MHVDAVQCATPGTSVARGPCRAVLHAHQPERGRHNLTLPTPPRAADACSPRYLAAYVDELARYGRPVWLTEFACPLGPRAGGEATQAAYMANALAVLDDAPAVERCARLRQQAVRPVQGPSLGCDAGV